LTSTSTRWIGTNTELLLEGVKGRFGGQSIAGLL
jgi:hypothetical protein